MRDRRFGASDPGDRIILHETVEMRSSSWLGSFLGTLAHEQKRTQTVQRGQQAAPTKEAASFD